MLSGQPYSAGKRAVERTPKRTELPSACPIAVSFDQDERKVCEVPPVFPHPRYELLLSCVTSIISEWHSCLSVFLRIRHVMNFMKLNDLRN